MERCLFCDRKATRLCDAVIAMVDGGKTHKAKGRPPHKVTTMDDMLSVSYTCDAPFCVEHGKVVGFVCGRPSVSDTIDHCAGCASDPREGRAPLLVPSAIAAIRNQMHARYRRARVALAPTYTPEPTP